MNITYIRKLLELSLIKGHIAHPIDKRTPKHKRILPFQERAKISGEKWTTQFKRKLVKINEKQPEQGGGKITCLKEHMDANKLSQNHVLPHYCSLLHFCRQHPNSHALKA
ncbi:18154_t:CDS:2 [Dentiscutata erythropus]|uniref:18154_t:CDS:1 n=1 Tax=Dentiscutata erythropus TaxID=1348616 RepID=A0A9N9G576_9GLOM|nr:18154_t:CDS:2 [Dentiscutata erythropus]